MSVALKLPDLWALVDKEGRAVHMEPTFDAACDWLDERYHYGTDGALYAQGLTIVRYAAAETREKGIAVNLRVARQHLDRASKKVRHGSKA